MIIKISLSLAAIAMAALFRHFWFARPSQSHQDEIMQQEPLATPPVEWPEGMPRDVHGVTCQGRGEIWWARVRVSYSHEPGASVYGWPAKGGIYVHTASAVEIEFLGFDRFKSVPHPSPNNPSAAPDEEAHCNKMRQLGAVWWKSEYAWSEDRRTIIHDRPPPDPTNSFIATGWPTTGGVWVLSTTKSEAVKKDAGVLFHAYSMDERCKVIEQLGGVFYSDPKDCPHLDLAEDSY